MYAGENMNAADLKTLVLAHYMRVLFLIVCAGMVGGSLSGLIFDRVSAQSRVIELPGNSIIDEVNRHETQLGAQGVEIGRQELQSQIVEREMETLREDGRRRDEAISALKDQVSVMHGIGIAVGAILGALMFLQMFFSRSRQVMLNNGKDGNS